MSAKKQTIRYLYVGKRKGRKGLVQVFLQDGDEEKSSSFRGIKNVYIGNTYLGLPGSMPVRPERVSDDAKMIPVTDKQTDRYTALEEVAREEARHAKAVREAEKKIAEVSRSKRIEFIRKELLEITEGFDYFDRAAFITALTMDTHSKKRKGVK